MLLKRIQEVENHLRQFVSSHFEVELDPLAKETPPRLEFGDLAFPFPFDLAKSLRRAPRKIAEEVVENIPLIDGVARFEAAGAGYVNVFLDRGHFFRELGHALTAPTPEPSGAKVVVEHTNINPNKAAHIGHLRNAALGDSFCRLLKAIGRRVEIQNYIDNTGVQVADVVVGFAHLRGLTLEQVRQIEDPFDYYCWDLYAEVSEWFAEDKDRLKFRADALHAIESGTGPVAELGEYIASRIVRAHINTMLRLGVRYDVLPRESEILHLRFWDQAFELLKDTDAIHFVDSGDHAGCWVMQLEEEPGQPADEKIIVRSNGTVTYVGKDIAYQLWKFGLLGRTFHYKPFYRYEDGHEVWVSSSEEGDVTHDFGNASQVFNVIDVRQSYLQRVVVQGLRRLGFNDEADRSIHFSYEMVALSHACCEELGIELSEEDAKRPFVEVSGRKGLGVKADDLIDKLIEKSLPEVRARQADLGHDQQVEIATGIAIGALRYFMLKYTRNAVIAFDFGEALAFEGETGPYLQYSVVRANNIFRKAEKQDPESLRQQIDWPKYREELDGWLADDDLWGLVLGLARTEEEMMKSSRSLEMSNLAKHAFWIAQQFNLFYHRHHILSEEDAVRKAFFLQIVEDTRRGLQQLFSVLGIPVPERM